jgi:hypothetical protein
VFPLLSKEFTNSIVSLIFGKGKGKITGSDDIFAKILYKNFSNGIGYRI